MHIKIIAASVIKKHSFLYDSLEEYKKRFNFIRLSITEFEDKNLNKEATNKKIISLCSKKSYKIILDEKGREFNTLDFKKFIISQAQREIEFLIAGADGFNESSKQQVDHVISLSKLTFPHQLARLLLVEQLYRVQCLINNHPYHRE